MRALRRLLFSTVLLLAVCLAARSPRAQTGLAGPGVDARFFDDSVVHDIYLRVNAADWQTLKATYLLNTYYPADFGTDESVVRNIGIRSRGSGSRSGTKPGLKVDFGRYTSGQTFVGLKSFVLRNNTQDPSNMHERLSMLLFARLGIPAPREAYARLWVNKQYVGLYTIVESLDKVFLQRAFGEDTGYLYSYEYPSDAPPFYFEDRGSAAAAYVPVPFTPETREGDPRADVIAQWVGAINRSTDAGFRTDIARYVELQAFVRFVAVEAFLGDDDGVLGNWGMNNFYSYRPEETTRFTLIPWDKSNAFMSGHTASIWHNLVDVPPAQRNRLMTRALASADIYSAYLDALAACVALTDAWQPDGRRWLEAEIQREYGQIRSSSRR
jgi:spore coat protein CotH